MASLTRLQRCVVAAQLASHRRRVAAATPHAACAAGGARASTSSLLFISNHTRPFFADVGGGGEAKFVAEARRPQSWRRLTEGGRVLVSGARFSGTRGGPALLDALFCTLCLAIGLVY